MRVIDYGDENWGFSQAAHTSALKARKRERARIERLKYKEISASRRAAGLTNFVRHERAENKNFIRHPVQLRHPDGFYDAVNERGQPITMRYLNGEGIPLARVNMRIV